MEVSPIVVKTAQRIMHECAQEAGYDSFKDLEVAVARDPKAIEVMQMIQSKLRDLYQGNRFVQEEVLEQGGSRC